MNSLDSLFQYSFHVFSCHVTREQRKRCTFLGCSALMRPDTCTDASELGQRRGLAGRTSSPRNSDANSNVTMVSFHRRHQLGEGATSLDQVIAVGRLLLLTGQPRLSHSLWGFSCGEPWKSITFDTEEARKQFN